MDAFDDLLGDRPDDAALERELRVMLSRRESDITEPAAVRVTAEDAATPIGPRFGDAAPGGLLVSLLAAAAVVLVVAGSLFAVHGLRHSANPATNQPSPPPASVVKPSPTGPPTGQPKSCPIPSSWIARISAGSITVDQPQNFPVSGASDGSVLIDQSASGQVNGQTDLTHQELAIFDQAGRGKTIWLAADPVHDYVDVSPDSAISANWVVYGLTRSQNLADHGVVAWNRATGQATTLRLLSSADEAANTVIDMSPIVVGNTAYWVERTYTDMRHQTLVSQPLPSGSRSTVQVSKVARLVALGGGVALLHSDGSPPGVGSTPSEPMTLTAGPGLTVPAAVLRAASGTWFSSDGTTLRWLSSRGATIQVRSWRAGQQLTDDSVADPPTSPTLVGPFLNSGTGSVLDTRNGTRLRMPAGTTFILTAGTDLIVTTGAGKLGGSGVSRVPISALVPTPC